MARLFDDGSSEYLIYDAPILTAAPLTMACWINTDTPGKNQMAIALTDGDAGDFDGFWLGIDGAAAAGRIVFSTWDGSIHQAIATDTASGDTWHHICAVARDTDDRSIFLDGGNEGTNSDDNTPAGVNNATIGIVYYNAGPDAAWYFSGSIAESAIWNEALTDAEVWQISHGVPPQLIRPGALTAYWPHIDGDRDVLRSGYHMTPVNSPAWSAHPRVVMDPYSQWGNRAGIRLPHRARLQGRILVPWAAKGAVTAVPRIPRPTAAYNNLAIY